MDAIRILGKAAVVACSLCLMIGFVWYRSAGARRSNPGPTAPNAAAQQANPAPLGVRPIEALPSSKSFVMPSGEMEKLFTPPILPGSKGGILLQPGDATTNASTSPESGNDETQAGNSRRMIDITSKSGRILESTDVTAAVRHTPMVMPGSKSAMVFVPKSGETESVAQQSPAARK